MTNIFQADKKRCGTMAKRIPKENIRPSEKIFSDGLFNNFNPVFKALSAKLFLNRLTHFLGRGFDVALRHFGTG